MGIKLGLYTHFKEGNRYIVYDVTTDEVTQKERVSYMSCNDKKKHSRFLDVFFEDVTDHPENKTGQKDRFEYKGSTVTYTVAHEIVESFKDFLEKNSIPIPFGMGDSVTYRTGNRERPFSEDEIVGINNIGVYVNSKDGVHVPVLWSQMCSVQLNFDK